jgi:hypothetical protein
MVLPPVLEAQSATFARLYNTRFPSGCMHSRALALAGEPVFVAQYALFVGMWLRTKLPSALCTHALKTPLGEIRHEPERHACVKIL